MAKESMPVRWREKKQSMEERKALLEAGDFVGAVKYRLLFVSQQM
jgi:hypothetical protein